MVTNTNPRMTMMTHTTDSDIPAHPAAEMFPLLDGEAFEKLVQDIRDHGQREPIVRFQGKVLDGRNRLRVCQQLGIEPRFVDLPDAQVGDPFAFVMSLNLHRRHLREHERGEILRRYLERRGWKPEEKHKGGRPAKDEELAQRGPVSVAKVAKELGIPKTTAQRQLQAAEDYRAAAPQLKAKVDAQITAKQARKATESAKTVSPSAPDDRDVQTRLYAHVKQQQRCATLMRWLDKVPAHFEELLHLMPRADDRLRDKARDVARQVGHLLPELEDVLAAPAAQKQPLPECSIVQQFLDKRWDMATAVQVRKLILRLPEQERERATAAAVANGPNETKRVIHRRMRTLGSRRRKAQEVGQS